MWPARSRTSRASDASMTPSRDLAGFQGFPRLGVEQGQQMSGLHEILQFGLLVAGQGTLLVLPSKLAHPVLVFLVKAEGQNVPGQFARQVALIRLDESPENRGLAGRVSFQCPSRCHMLSLPLKLCRPCRSSS